MNLKGLIALAFLVLITIAAEKFNLPDLKKEICKPEVEMINEH